MRVIIFLVVSGMVLRITGADKVSEGSDCTEVRREVKKEETVTLITLGSFFNM